MGMAGQRSYNTPNPQNFNYPKLMHMKGSYPKFAQKEEQSSKTNGAESANLAKELEKQIKELQKLTKEAKDLAKTKLKETKIENKSNENNKVPNLPNKRLRHSNLDQVLKLFYKIFLTLDDSTA